MVWWPKPLTGYLAHLRREMDAVFRVARTTADKMQAWSQLAERLRRSGCAGRSPEDCRDKHWTLVRYFKDTAGGGPYAHDIGPVLAMAAADVSPPLLLDYDSEGDGDLPLQEAGVVVGDEGDEEGAIGSKGNEEGDDGGDENDGDSDAEARKAARTLVLLKRDAQAQRKDDD